MNQETTELADRIRDVIGDDPNISEKKMFGGVCFMLNGNMLCGASGTGNLMLRIGKEKYEEVLGLPFAKEMDFTGRVMKGFVYVEPDGYSNQEDMKRWIAVATDFVGSLPPK